MIAFEPTSEQIAAIKCNDSCVITACPGSGKTAVVSAKVRNVLPDLPQYRGVIAISYTNKASAELKKRCALNATDVKNSFFGTIDAFCIAEIVIPFLPHYHDGVAVEVDVVKLNSLDSDLRAIFDKAIDDPEEFLEASILLLKKGKIVLEIVGKLASEILISSKACQAYIKARYSHVYIDEYQDSGVEQHRLFLLLKSLGLVATAVGDAKQSIYAFAGRDPKFLQELCAEESDFVKFELTQNHRSHPSIINYSNRLLDPCCALIPSEETCVYRKVIVGGPREIGNWIDSALPKIMEYYSVTQPSAIAVLTKGSATAEAIAAGMKTKTRLSSDSRLEHSNLEESRRFASILRMRFDPRSTVQALVSATSIPGGSIAKKLLRHALAKCKTGSDTILVAAMSDAVRIASGSPPSAESLVELASALTDPTEVAALTPPEDDEVQLMTLHKSKGLEFDVVIHLDLLDWVLPKRVVVQGDYGEHFEDWDQCLNLHYVGLTRARKACLLVTSTRRINAQGQEKAGNPSQFLSLPGLDNLYKQLKQRTA